MPGGGFGGGGLGGGGLGGVPVDGTGVDGGGEDGGGVDDAGGGSATARSKTKCHANTYNFLHDPGRESSVLMLDFPGSDVRQCLADDGLSSPVVSAALDQCVADLLANPDALRPIGLDALFRDLDPSVDAESKTEPTSYTTTGAPMRGGSTHKVPSKVPRFPSACLQSPRSEVLAFPNNGSERAVGARNRGDDPSALERSSAPPWTLSCSRDDVENYARSLRHYDLVLHVTNKQFIAGVQECFALNSVHAHRTEILQIWAKVSGERESTRDEISRGVHFVYQHACSGASALRLGAQNTFRHVAKAWLPSH